MGQGTSKPKQGAAKNNNPPKFSPKRGLTQCKNCTRNFASDRIETHMNICTKAVAKRKPFDISKARVEGTEAANFVEKKQGMWRKKVSADLSIKLNYGLKHSRSQKSLIGERSMKNLYPH